MSQASIAAIGRILDIHLHSQGEIRPHFILTGPSGSGKTHNIMAECDARMIQFFEINCAAITKEGLSGNSMSKALAPIANSAGSPCVVFMDEFDKLFISGNSNTQLAHESTNGVQNELLKMLESQTTSVYTGNYGQYEQITVDHCLFVFAGAFNGEADITLDRLRDMGLKTELLGRIGLTYSLEKVKLEVLLEAARTSELLDKYAKLTAGFTAKARQKAIDTVCDAIRDSYEHNTIGFRAIAALYHRYFIDGTLETPKKNIVFTKQLVMATPSIFET